LPVSQASIERSLRYADRLRLQYLDGLPTEFRVLCARDATLRQPAIRCAAGCTKCAGENHHAIA
jgi:hypothetical protein